MDEELTDVQLENCKALLIALKQGLEEALELKQESSKTVELDQQLMGRLSRMDALQHQAMAKAGKEVQQLRLQLVKQALRAVEEGTYGECRECGEFIPYKRLEVKPEAPFCLPCQQEKEGGVGA